jgi:hypothetical protein
LLLLLLHTLRNIDTFGHLLELILLLLLPSAIEFRPSPPAEVSHEFRERQELMSFLVDTGENFF